jgi:hypothetical protein
MLGQANEELAQGLPRMEKTIQMTFSKNHDIIAYLLIFVKPVHESN